MKIITIYGEIEGGKIFSNGQIYNLEKDSLVYPRDKGWFHVEKVNDCWRLFRMLRESRAEVYPNWVDQDKCICVDFVSI